MTWPSTKKKYAKFILAALLLIAGVGVCVFILPGKADFARLRGGKNFNIILITLDTTRADRLGCYGFKNIETPTIDRFASLGIKFERCFSTTPLTLPAHTSIMTGTLPPFHGVRDNGGFIVPREIKTMATLLKDKGYATSAFVAAYVLDSKWGLNRGFDVYFDNFDLSKFEKISLSSVQRPANEVLDQALTWLDKNKDKQFFTWIHLYDPHSPYEPPPPFDKEYSADPYLGEIAFVDSQLGRLLNFLEISNHVRDSFIVVVGDHGESLGEHDEENHGFFVYQAAIHVPLIFVTPFSRFQGHSSPRVCSIADVLPTICEMAGIPAPGQVQGESLVAAFDGNKSAQMPLAYSETYYPRFHYGWSELISVQNARYKLILAPIPELYDVVKDPAEEENLVYHEKKVYEDMSAKAERIITKSGLNGYKIDVSKIDEEVRARLTSLGYIGSFADPSNLKGKKLANPRDKIGVFNELNRARELGMTGQNGEAIKIIKNIIVSDPDITEAYFSLGNIYFKEQRFEDAISTFRLALEQNPDDPSTVINIAASYISLKKSDEAERFILDYLKRGFSDPQLLSILGNINFLQKKYDQAISYYQECLSRDPQSACSHNALARIYTLKDDVARANEHVRAALQINPDLTDVHYNLALVLEKQQKVREAEDAYLEELRISPRHFKAMYNLSRLYRQEGNEALEMEYLKKCIDSEPSFPLSYFYLARIYLNRGISLNQAVGLVEKGIELKPERSELALGYFLLADIYNRLGDDRHSEECAKKAQDIARSR